MISRIGWRVAGWLIALVWAGAAWAGTCTNSGGGGDLGGITSASAAVSYCGQDKVTFNLSGSCADIGGVVQLAFTRTDGSTGTTCYRYTASSCPANGTPQSSVGYVEYGTNAANSSALSGASCASNGCWVVFTGNVPAGKSAIDGITHYYGYGYYQYIASSGLGSCTPGSGNAPKSVTSSLPDNTCGGTDVPTMRNGVIVCVVAQTGATSTTTPEDVKVGTVTTRTTQPDGSVLEVSTTTYGDGSKSYASKIFDNSTSTVPSSSETKIDGSAGSFADKANPGVKSAGGGSGDFPSDYSRSGEALVAANTVKDALGPKLDKLVEASDAPGDLVVPNSGYTDFGTTFQSLLGWQVPGHTSQCPTASFNTPWNTAYTVDSHCQLITNNWSALQAAMAVVWTIGALFIVLRA